MICTTFKFYLAIGSLPPCNCSAKWIFGYLLEDSLLSGLSFRPVICFACPTATFHLSDVRQVYDQPSLCRTIGSRVSRSPTLGETVQYHSRDEPCFPCTHAYWLKNLLTVPLLTCNLLPPAAEREPDHTSSLGPNMLYVFHIATAKLCLSVPSALGLNLKQASVQGRLTGEPYVS